MKTQDIDIIGLINGKYHYKYDLLPFHTEKMPLSKKMNVVLAASNLRLHKTNVYHMPISVFFELTNYCNLRCPICATGNGHLERKPKNMEPILFQSVLEQINKYVLIISLWGWGESLLHPQIEDMLKIAYEKGVKEGVQVVVSTNGQNLDNMKILKALIKYPPTYIICTVDGLTDDILSIYRVGAKLNPILEGVKYLAQHRVGEYPQLHMRTIVMQQNEGQLVNINQWAKEHYFDNLSLRGLVQIVPNPDFEKFVPKSNEYKSYMYNEGNKRIHNEQFFCRDSLMIPIVHSDGDLCICCEDFNGKLCYGSLYTNNFKDLWFSDKANEIREMPINRQDLKPCLLCPMVDRTRPITNLEFRSLS